MAKFPFNPSATTEVSQQELQAIFDPTNGPLSQLNNGIRKSNQQVGPGFRNFLDRALGLQQALYMGGSGQIQFKYKLRPRPSETVTSLTMNVDGQTLTYSGGNAPFQQFAWPGSTAQGVTLTGKISGGSELGLASFDGLWGVFHFFADAKWMQTASTYNIEYVAHMAGAQPIKAGGKPVAVQFELDTVGAPPILQKGYFANMPRCVSTVAK